MTKKHQKIALLEEKVRRLASKDFLVFYKYLYPDFTISWHHALICKEYQKLIDEDNQKLAISMPPGHAKSFLTNLFAAWQIGRAPDTRIISTSYSDRLVRRNCDAVKEIVCSEKFQKVFPDTKIDKDSTLTSKEFHIKNDRGYYMAEPAGGQITGLRADLLLCDDPIKGMREARSGTQMTTLKEWYDATFRSRGHSLTKEIVIHTRWTQDDLIGWLMDREGSDWINVVLPAIKEGTTDEHEDDPRAVGEVLWSYIMPKETLEKRKSQNPRLFLALYQQKPSPPGGEIIKNDWVTQKFTTPPKSFDQIIQSWDLRNGGKGANSSYAVGQLWAKSGPDVYLIDQVRGRWDFPTTLEIMETKLQDPMWSQAKSILIEDKADGRTAIPILKQKFSGITPVSPKGSKEERLSATTAYWSAGNVLLPKHAHWVDEFASEITGFPGASTDDQVDAATQALEYLFQKQKPEFAFIIS